MSQQAQDDYYGSPEKLALGYAEAVNEEIKDLFAAGADIVQLDEPYLQARPEEARSYGIAVLNRALEGITGTTAVHVCFGYAAIIHDRPEGYSFLPELAAARCDQVSIETAQSGLDCSVLAGLDGKTIILGVLNLNDVAVETPGQIADRVRTVLQLVVPAEGRHLVVDAVADRALQRQDAVVVLLELVFLDLRRRIGPHAREHELLQQTRLRRNLE